MSRHTTIPPGRAGLIVLAVAMVPIAVKKFPKVVRWVGRKIETTGQRIQRTVDEVHRFDREREEREIAERERKGYV